MQSIQWMLVAGVVGMAASAFGQAAWPIDQTIPNQIGMQLKEHDLNIEGTFSRIKEFGAKYVRRGALWNVVEKEKGVYDFSRYVKLVDDAHAHGMSTVITLALQNKLYPHPKDEEGRAAYVKYCVAAVEAFKGKPVLFEIWNEPNTKTFWGAHEKSGNTDSYAEQYVNLVKAAVPAMKKADPTCIILGGSMSNVWSESFKWMTFCTKRGVMDTGIDAWSLHPYGVKNPEDYLEAYDICRKIMKDNGSGKMLPFLNTERGFALSKDKEGANTVDDRKQSMEYQAWHLVRQYLVDQLCDIKLTIWYEWSGGESFSVWQPKEPHFFPAHNAGKVMVEQLTGYKFDNRIKTDNERDFVLQFKNPTGGVKLVAWTSPPKGQTPDKTVNHAIDIPVQTSAASLALIQIYGEAGSVEVKNGTVNVALTGAPQYIVVNAGK